TQTDAARDEGLLGVVRNGVLVDGDVCLAQRNFGILAGNALGAQVDQHDVAFGAAGDDPQTALDQRLGQHLGVLHDLLRVVLELGRERFLERNRFGRDNVHERAALDSREDGGVDDFLVLGLHHDHTAARPAEGLVGGGGDEIGVRNGVGVDAAGDQASVVGDVDHEQRAVFVCDAGHALEVDAQGIGGRAAHDQLRLVFTRQPLELVGIELFFLVQAVRNEVVQLAGGIDRRTVSQVTAFGHAHAQDGIARLEHRHIDALGGLRAGARLHAGSFGTEDLLQPVDGPLLDDIDVLAATVVALARIPFRIFVGQLGALGLHDGGAGVVLGSDQLDMLFLALVLFLNGGPDFGIDLV